METFVGHKQGFGSDMIMKRAAILELKRLALLRGRSEPRSGVFALTHPARTLMRCRFL